MNRIAATLVAVALTVVGLTSIPTTAQASSLPRCAARTVDAVSHHTPLTPPGVECEVWFGDYIPPTWPVVASETSGLGSSYIFLVMRSPVLPSLCVTTTWRAKHTGQPKTRPGQVCRFQGLTSRAPMWLPGSWRTVGEWLDTSGQIQDLVQAH